MIQFNLLPDIKLEHIKTLRRKRAVMVISSVAVVASLTVTILLFLVVNFVQKRQISSLSERIKERVSNLEGTEDLNKILTIQNQLLELPALHNQKPVASRVFDYLTAATPVDVNVAKFDIDFTTQTVKVDGSTGSLAAVNQFVDTLKFTNYVLINENGEPVADQPESKAFSKVVLDNFGINETEATYSVSFIYDPVIFDSANSVRLAIPNTITTRSITEKPLFKPNPQVEE